MLLRVMGYRRWAFLLPIALGVGVGGFLALRISTSSGKITLTPLLIGLGGALALSLVLLLLAFRQDGRLLALRDRHPEAVVVNILTHPQLFPDLAVIKSRILDTTGVGWTVSLVADATGLSLWKGGARFTELASAPWSDVGTIELGSLFKPLAQAAHDRLKVELTGPSGSGTVEFGVVPEPRGLSSRTALSEDELLELAQRIESVRGRGVTVATPPSATWKGLVDGRTAWSLTRWGPVSLSALAIVIQGAGFIAFVLARIFESLPLLYTALALLVPLYIAGFIQFRLLRGAMEREKKAGYTTLNGGQLALEQRHPFTGVVIRAPGARALSRQEFADHLGRP